jgi:hypothetical protein
MAYSTCSKGRLPQLSDKPPPLALGLLPPLQSSLEAFDLSTVVLQGLVQKMDMTVLTVGLLRTGQSNVDV